MTSIFIIFFCVWIVIFWLISLIHCVSNKQLSDTNRVVGILLIVFLGILGSIAYIVLPRLELNNRRRSTVNSHSSVLGVVYTFLGTFAALVILFVTMMSLESWQSYQKEKQEQVEQQQRQQQREEQQAKANFDIECQREQKREQQIALDQEYRLAILKQKNEEIQLEKLDKHNELIKAKWAQELREKSIIEEARLKQEYEAARERKLLETKKQEQLRAKQQAESDLIKRAQVLDEADFWYTSLFELTENEELFSRGTNRTTYETFSGILPKVKIILTNINIQDRDTLQYTKLLKLRNQVSDLMPDAQKKMNSWNTYVSSLGSKNKSRRDEEEASLARGKARRELQDQERENRAKERAESRRAQLERYRAAGGLDAVTLGFGK